MTNLIEINGLSKSYPSFCLKDVSFNVPGGSIVGFVGENGAGKTTTIKSILNVIHRDSGSIRLMGLDNIKDGAKARASVGVVYDECSFHDWLTAPMVGAIMKNIYKT